MALAQPVVPDAVPTARAFGSSKWARDLRADDF